MNKIVNLIFLIIIVIFFFSIIKHYSSSYNIKKMNSNRINIEKNIKEKIFKLPILKNDTDKVVEFNSSYSDEIENDKPRNFWDLLKVK